jgi:hypothetical protein
MFISLNNVKPTVFVMEKHFAVRRIGTEFLILIRSTENQNSLVLVHGMTRNLLYNMNSFTKTEASEALIRSWVTSMINMRRRLHDSCS